MIAWCHFFLGSRFALTELGNSIEDAVEIVLARFAGSSALDGIGLGSIIRCRRCYRRCIGESIAQAWMLHVVGAGLIAHAATCISCSVERVHEVLGFSDCFVRVFLAVVVFDWGMRMCGCHHDHHEKTLCEALLEWFPVVRRSRRFLMGRFCVCLNLGHHFLCGAVCWCRSVSLQRNVSLQREAKQLGR